MHGTPSGTEEVEREEREKGKAETEDWTADAIDRISHVPLELHDLQLYIFPL